MRIFLNRWFARFARRDRLTTAQLCEAVDRAVRGLIDADLGHGIIKQRVGRSGQGRSGGYRVLIVFRSADRAVFVRGFAKNERDTLEPDEFRVIKDVAKEVLVLTELQMDRLVAGKEFTELKCDGQAVQE